MKKRRVMRLLAVVMAVAVAVTSQGIPKVLTSVYAEDSKNEDSQNSKKSETSVSIPEMDKLVEGHLYRPVTPDIGTGSYTYNKIVASGGDAVEESTATTITDISKIIAVGEDYYYDVTDQFVTKIAITDTNVRYIKDDTTEEELEDRVLLTFGQGSTNGKGLNSEVVKSNLSGKIPDDNGGYTVTIGAIEDNVDMYAALDTSSEGKVVTASDAVVLSEITDFSQSTTGLAISGSYTVKIMSDSETEEITIDAGTSTISVKNEDGAYSLASGYPSYYLGNILEPYTNAGGLFTGTFEIESGKTNDISSAIFDAPYADYEFVRFELGSDVKTGDTVLLTGKLTNAKYTVTVTLTIDIRSSGTTIKDLTLNSLTTYYGVNREGDLKTILGDNYDDYVAHPNYYEITYGDDRTKEMPTGIGNTTVYVSYNDGQGTIGTKSARYTIEKLPLTVSARNQTVKKGGSVSQTEYTVSSSVWEGIPSLPSGLTATAKVTNEEGEDVTSQVSTLAVGEYEISYEITGDKDGNYAITSESATLTIEEDTGSASPSITPSTDKTDTDETDTDKTDTDKTDTKKTVTEGTITTNEDGNTVIVDKNGDAVTNSKVTLDGKSYITDENGEVLTSQVTETPSGNKVYVDEDGVIVKDKTITAEDGTRYLATKSGKIATDGFYTTPSGNKVYATTSGALQTGKTFTVDGKKYYAKTSGAIATTGFVKTAAGNTVYATKSGVIKVNKVFIVNGKKYVATKSGTVVKGKKYTIGNKTYTTNKKGEIIKVTTKK